jgi:capsular exopolysaccharide synthesis family protein
LLAAQWAEIAGLRAKARESERKSREFDPLKAEIDQLQAEVKQIADEKGRLEVSLPVTPRVAVMEAADVPKAPKADRSAKVAGGVGFGLFGLAFLGVALLEVRRRRVYSAGDVSQRLGLPLVGTVPATPPTKAGAPAVAEGPLVESVDGIRTLLLHAGRSEPLRVLMVASAVAGEGKTSLASQLAASLARAGRRTLLADCDLRDPAAHKLFGLAAAPGFSELLRAECEPADVVQTTPVENLDLLPAGACDRKALQALANEAALQHVFDDLKEQYDFVILDVCPVLPVADALLLGRHADGVLLAVLRNVSRLPQVHAAHQRLAAVGVRTLGAVVLGDDAPGYGPVRYPTA